MGYINNLHQLYHICIISNNLFNYFIQNYSGVPLTIKNRIIPISKPSIMNASANHLIVEYST